MSLLATVCVRRCRLSNICLARFFAVHSSKIACNSDKITHTGQQWSREDYRNARYINRTKQINEQFAIDLVAEDAPVIVNGSQTWCDGGNTALGHPKVYINLDKPEIGVCGYCGKQFVSKHNNI